MGLSTQTSSPAPPRIIVYGPPGVGKTTFACGAPNPVVLPIEDGLGELRVPTITSSGRRILVTAQDVTAALDYLGGEHPYGTVVLDSFTALQQLIASEVARNHGVSAIDEIAFGKGWSKVSAWWADMLARLDTIRSRGTAVICTAHATVKYHEDPEAQGYDRMEMRLQHANNVSIRSQTREWADGVYYADLARVVTQTGKGDAMRVRAVDQGGKRVLKLHPSSARDGKDRLGLPKELPLEWSAFQEAYKNRTTTETTTTP